MKSCSMYILLIIIFLSSCSPKYNVIYKRGKDTHCLYGDGTYQILSTGIYSDNRILTDKKYHLYNLKYKTTVMHDISDYKKDNEMVYLKGTDKEENRIYIIIDIKTNQIKCYSSNEVYPTFMYAQILEENGELLIIKDFEQIDETGKKYFYELKWSN